MRPVLLSADLDSCFRRSLGLAIAITVFTIGCQENQKPRSSPNPTRVNIGAERANTADVPVVTRTKHLMGTVFSITIADKENHEVEPVVRSAFSEISRLEKLLSDRIEQSEISRINASAGVKAVKVSADTMKVLKAGMEVARWSDGAFDLSWAALRGLYSFSLEAQRFPSPREVQRRLRLINYRDIAIDETNQTAMLRRKGMRLGVGAIGKGFALDRASEILTRAGFANFMLFAGGQVQVKGKRGNRFWRVGIRHPRRSGYFGVLEVKAGAISTSGDYENAFIEDGKRWHHILDPKTGLPVEHTISVTAITSTGIYADALSTAIFVLGPSKSLKRLSSAPGKPEAVIVDSDLKLIKSPGVAKLLELKVALDQGRLPL
jgi:thiamine biosynthesis lipoprotein